MKLSMKNNYWTNNKLIKSFYVLLDYFDFNNLFCKTLLYCYKYITLCLSTLTLNLSKSDNCLLLALPANLLPQLDSENFFSNPKSSTAFLSFNLFSPLETSKRNSVNCNLLIEISCLLTPEVGPSTSTLEVFKISTITTNFPYWGP